MTQQASLFSCNNVGMAIGNRKVRETIAATNRSSNLSINKAKQGAKIGELRRTLTDAGFGTLDEQAVALGIVRSTAWTTLKCQHKASGLSATTIKRMWRSPNLPASARREDKEYIEQKCAGEFGHSESRIRLFRVGLAQY
jgi:hypothetical protein